MYIHRLRKTTMGNGGSMTKKTLVRNVVSAAPMKRTMGSGIVPEVYQMSSMKPTEILRNIKISKPRLPKKYITFE